MQIDFVNNRFKITFEYDPEVVQKLKATLKFKTFDRESKASGLVQRQPRCSRFCSSLAALA